MAASTVIKNNMDGQLTIKDGTGTPLTLTVPYEMGDFSLTGMAKKNRAVQPYQSRGVLRSLRHTELVFPTGSFTAMMSHFTSATATSLADIILANGYFASAVSTLGSSADVYTLDLSWSTEGSNFGDSGDHAFVLEDCYCTIDFAEGDPNMFTLNFTCYGAITGDIAI